MSTLLVASSDSLRRWRSLAIAAIVLFLSACSFMPAAKGERLALLQEHLNAGDVAWQGRNYEAARTAYGAARLLAPGDAQLAFRLGMSNEHLGNYAEAADAYRGALQVKSVPDKLRHDLTYRLALLEAFRLHGEEKVPALLATLPPASSVAADLRAVIALLAGDGRRALAALNEARAFPLSQEEASIILYHAAQAYHLTGEIEMAKQSLFEAINRAGYAPVSRDITEFREVIIKQPRH